MKRPSMQKLILSCLSFYLFGTSSAPTGRLQNLDERSDREDGHIVRESSCMNASEAQQVALNYASLLDNYSDQLAQEAVTTDFKEYSSSTNYLTSNSCSSAGALRLQDVTFDSQDALRAGQGSQPPIPFQIRNTWHRCDVVIVRWISEQTPQTVTGIVVLETQKASKGSAYNWLIKIVYSEFNTGAWLVNLGVYVPTCCDNEGCAAACSWMWHVLSKDGNEGHDQPDARGEMSGPLLNATGEINSAPFTDSKVFARSRKRHSSWKWKPFPAKLLPSTTSHSETTPNRRRRAPPRRQPIWLWEYLIIVLSVTCMVAIAIILLAMHGKRLSSWGLPISPNALVSVFATISKSAMLLALAEGISQLKWVYFRCKPHRLSDFQTFDDASRGPWGAVKLILRVGHKAWFASAGAMIVVLSLAMDPFVQQILTFRARMIPMHNTTASIGTATMFDSGPAWSKETFDYNYESATTQNQITMPASDLLNSLVRGIFASDTNTDYQCPTGNCTWQPFDSLGVCSDCTKAIENEVCSPRNCLFKSITPDPYEANENLYASASATFDCNNSTFANIVIVYRDDRLSSWEQMPAYNCTLSFCKKTYTQSSFSIGNLYDQPTSSSTLVPWPQAPNITTNTTLLCPFRAEEDVQSNKSDATAYWINKGDINAVGTAIKPLFWTTLLTSLGANNYVASALYRRNGGNIPATMDSVATSMTNQVRQGPNATMAQGTALIPQVYIHVSWVWLVLPASLVLLSSTFLALTAQLLTGKGDVVWKSSTLATLFHGMHGLGNEEAKLISISSMSDAAHETYALLGDDQDGRMALHYSDKSEGLKESGNIAMQPCSVAEP